MSSLPSTNSDKRALNQGFGDGMSRAFELVMTPAFFAGVGYLIDLAAGTSPVFAVALATFGVVGVFVRAWYGYDAEMRVHESSGRWVRGAERPRCDEPADIWASRREVGP